MGGHLVLEEAGVVLEMGQGDNASFPSSCITHYNIPVQAGESCWSLVGHSAGMLFQAKELAKEKYKGESSAAIKEMLLSSHHQQVAEGWDRFSTLEDLKCSRAHKGIN